MAEFEHLEELVVGLYDTGEIGYMSPPGSDVEVEDPDYPQEVFKKLKSGRMSPHYVNGRNLTAFSNSLPVPIEHQARVRDLAVDSTAELLEGQKYDHLLGIPQAMTCLAGLIAQKRGDSVLWLRVGEKSYGIHDAIQGHFGEGESVAALDNVITDGGSKLEVIEPLRGAGLQIASFDVLVDREEGGKEAMEEAGHPFLAVVGMQTINKILFETGRITGEQHRWAIEYRERMLNPAAEN